MEFDYDPALDRLDTAVRSVWHDANKGGHLLREAGISGETIAAVQELAGKRGRPTNERQVFAVLKVCPEALGAALLLLHHYYLTCGDGRTLFYERLGRLYE